MIYVIVKMSSKYYVQKYDDVSAAEENIQDHVDGGDIIIVTDDYEYFASTMGIDIDEFEMVEN